MYTLNVTNNYISDLGVSNGVTVKKGKTWEIKRRGSLFLMVPGMGEINFIDLGDKKLEGYPLPKETWGVLIRTQSSEAYYRYEGGGELIAIIDHIGTVHLSTKKGTMIRIRIPELIIN
ncbi:hypothetical protein [Polaribacter sp. NJDZ03]|uniref:hypothetical protein n=1 Tax=Polaribacter sp. NJDZ03 TaxID=2855841 RepID=UPI001C49DB9E|nr:hypothetical protein [Polaribacter sp. NJDZ03]